jgi:hypothetical protein
MFVKLHLYFKISALYTEIETFCKNFLEKLILTILAIVFPFLEERVIRSSKCLKFVCLSVCLSRIRNDFFYFKTFPSFNRSLLKVVEDQESECQVRFSNPHLIA